MNNEQPSPTPKRKFRVEGVHGGENVEEIEKVELMNDPECIHEQMHRDYTETDFIAFVCDNPKCGMVKLFNK